MTKRLQWNPGKQPKVCGRCGAASNGFFCVYDQNGSCSAEHQSYCVACKRAVEPVLLLDFMVNA